MFVFRWVLPRIRQKCLNWADKCQEKEEILRKKVTERDQKEEEKRQEKNRKKQEKEEKKKEKKEKKKREEAERAERLKEAEKEEKETKEEKEKKETKDDGDGLKKALNGLAAAEKLYGLAEDAFKNA